MNQPPDRPPTLDAKGLELLFRTHYTGLCRFASGYVKDYEAAREIVQDAFVSLWDKRDTIDMSKPVKSYLSTAIRNKCLNYLRDNRKFSDDLLALENLPADAFSATSDPLNESDIARVYAQAMEELPEKCREVFELSRNRFMKYQEIADHLQISVKTVETQMSKALRHFRLRLADYLPVISAITAGALIRVMACLCV